MTFEKENTTAFRVQNCKYAVLVGFIGTIMRCGEEQVHLSKAAYGIYNYRRLFEL